MDFIKSSKQVRHLETESILLYCKIKHFKSLCMCACMCPCIFPACEQVPELDWQLKRPLLCPLVPAVKCAVCQKKAEPQLLLSSSWDIMWDILSRNNGTERPSSDSYSLFAINTTHATWSKPLNVTRVLLMHKQFHFKGLHIHDHYTPKGIGSQYSFFFNCFTVLLLLRYLYIMLHWYVFTTIFLLRLKAVCITFFSV